MSDKATATLTWGVRFDPEQLSEEDQAEFENDYEDWLVRKLVGLPAMPDEYGYKGPKWEEYWEAKRKAIESCKFELYRGGGGDDPHYVLGHKDRTTQTDWSGPKVLDPQAGRPTVPFELGQALSTLGLGQPMGRWYLLAYFG